MKFRLILIGFPGQATEADHSLKSGEQLTEPADCAAD